MLLNWSCDPQTQTYLGANRFLEISQKALEYAVPLAKQFEAKITLLHAIEPLPYPMDLTYVSMGEEFSNRAPGERTEYIGEKDDRAATLKRSDCPSGHGL